MHASPTSQKHLGNHFLPSFFVSWNQKQIKKYPYFDTRLGIFISGKIGFILATKKKQM
jgi:hypothetical protein